MHSFQLHMLSSLIKTLFNPNSDVLPVMNYSSVMNSFALLQENLESQQNVVTWIWRFLNKGDNPVGLTTSKYRTFESELSVILVSWFGTKPELWRKASWSYNLRMNAASATYKGPASCLTANIVQLGTVYGGWMQAIPKPTLQAYP